MALIHSKQLNPKLTGSFIISGSNPLSVIGGTTSDFLKVNTHITASGDISGSGLLIISKSISTEGPLSVVGASNLQSSLVVGTTANIGGNTTIGGDSIVTGNINTSGHITASGDISSSGNLFVSKNVDIDGTSHFLGHITASGNISASGTVFASRFESAGASSETISFNDNIDLSGNLIFTGNLSGSATTTGSFGKIELTKGTSLNSGNFAISGSTTSTASFGLIKIHEIQGNSTIAFGDNIIAKKDVEVRGNLSGSGDLTIGGDIVASGDIFASQFRASGSTSMTFGNTTADNHQFTGSVLVSGSLNVEKGRVFEQGTSVIDHATAMAIVFGG